MAQFFKLHPENPQPRLLRQAGDILRQGGVVVYPTDSGYALGCMLGFVDAQQRIRQIRQVDDSHLFSLVCRNLAEIGTYAVVSNSQFRLLKANTPGPYTFILKASREVPKKLQHPKRNTVGIRVPDFPVTQAILAEIDAPLLNMSLNAKALNYDEQNGLISEGWEVREQLEHAVDLIIDIGSCPFTQTSVVSLMNESPALIRAGIGDLSAFGLEDEN
jgi:tRNA threonylcarbamoyl adenosine modification protein (Sua5/YciO/YrdC/YwlC family)